jgi:hypothetical protein
LVQGSNRHFFSGALDLIATSRDIVRVDLQGVTSFRHLSSQLQEIQVRPGSPPPQHTRKHARILIRNSFLCQKLFSECNSVPKSNSFQSNVLYVFHTTGIQIMRTGQVVLFSNFIKKRMNLFKTRWRPKLNLDYVYHFTKKLYILY